MSMDKRVLPPGAFILKGYDYILQQRYIDYPNISFINKNKYNYIVIEGIDGAGKTTVAQLVVSELKRRNIDSELVYEPYTEEIRTLLNRSPDINPIVEAMLFAADRMYLHSEVLSKMLQDGKVVIGDRSFIASIVYQVVRGAPEEFVISINSFAIKPSLIILLDITPETAIERLERKKSKQLLHLEKPSFLLNVRQRYFDVLKSMGIPHHVINAERNINAVLEDVLSVILKNLV